jgi:hypothetical protein
MERTRELGNEPNSYSHLISDKLPKTHAGGKTASSTGKRCWENWMDILMDKRQLIMDQSCKCK